MKQIPAHTVLGTMVEQSADGITSKPNRAMYESVTASAIVKGNKKDPLPHSYIVQRIRYPKGVNRYTVDYGVWGKWTTEQSGYIAFGSEDPFLAGITMPTWLYNTALSKLNERVRGTLDLSVDLAQAGQTARMFNALKSARDYISSFRSWRALVSGASQARLEFAYGWSPLASSIYGIADESLRLVMNEIESVKVRTSESLPSSIGSFDFQFQGSVPGMVTRDGRYICELGIKYRTAGHNIDRWMSLNPLSLAWELTPYSFVIDWIIDVGSYLRDVETSLLYANSFVNGYRSEGIFMDAWWEGSRARTEKYGPVNQHTYVTTANASCLYREFARSALSSYPVPRLPSFKAGLGAGRLLNLAALMGSKLSK